MDLFTWDLVMSVASSNETVQVCNILSTFQTNLQLPTWHDLICSLITS